MSFVTITDDSYVSHCWVLPGRGADFLMFLHRPTPADKFILAFRFRYYEDGKVWNSTDRKRGGTIEAPDNVPGSKHEELLIEAGDKIIDELLSRNFNPEHRQYHRIEVGGGISVFLEKCGDLPYFFAKKA